MTHLPSTLSAGKEQYLTAGGYLNEETNNRNASAICQDSSTGFCRPGTACQRETNWETLLCHLWPRSGHGAQSPKGGFDV